jgi:hypothetical protein
MITILSAYDQNYKSLMDISKTTIINYAKKYNYNFNFIEIPNNYERPSPWYKIELLKKYFQKDPDNESEYILWIDCDAIILNTNFDLLSCVKTNKFLYISKDVNAINSGVMLIKKNKYMYDFLTEVWNKTEFIDHIWWENAAIIYLIETNFNNINAHIEYLPQKYFNSYDYKYYGYDHNHQGHVCEESFIFHTPGLPKTIRLELMKYYMKEYHK